MICKRIDFIFQVPLSSQQKESRKMHGAVWPMSCTKDPCWAMRWCVCSTPEKLRATTGCTQLLSTKSHCQPTTTNESSCMTNFQRCPLIANEPDWGSNDLGESEQKTGQQAQDRSQHAQDCSQQEEGSSLQAQDSSQQAQGSSQQAQDSSQ